MNTTIAQTVRSREHILECAWKFRYRLVSPGVFLSLPPSRGWQFSYLLSPHPPFPRFHALHLKARWTHVNTNPVWPTHPACAQPFHPVNWQPWAVVPHQRGIANLPGGCPHFTASPWGKRHTVNSLLSGLHWELEKALVSRAFRLRELFPYIVTLQIHVGLLFMSNERTAFFPADKWRFDKTDPIVVCALSKVIVLFELQIKDKFHCQESA